MAERIRLGDMLVAAGMVTEGQVEEALKKQRELSQRLGETLVTLGYVNESQMLQVLSNQLSVPWVNLYHVDFSRELLDMIPADLAERCNMVPVYVRNVRRHGDTLYVALDDPLNMEALQDAADASGLPVKPMVASSTDIKNAIRVYYMGLPPLEEEDEEDEPVLEYEAIDLASLPPDEVASLTEEEEPAAPAPVVSAVPSVPPEAREKPRGFDFRTLTFLDGTTVKLPSPRGDAPAEGPVERGLTTRDLIHALSARAAGEDVGDVLPDDAWEPLFAALLSVLLRKRLVADWEFVDEWKKQRRKSQKE